jgi:hypothetical protein
MVRTAMCENIKVRLTLVSTHNCHAGSTDLADATYERETWPHERETWPKKAMLQFTSLYSLTLDVPVTVCVVLEYSFFIFALPPFNILASKICNQRKKAWPEQSEKCPFPIEEVTLRQSVPYNLEVLS